MQIVASAPGKLVLIGEYAVLDGAPALVLAVNRRARVTLTAQPGTVSDIVSPTLGLAARLRLRDDGSAWVGVPPPELAWIATLLQQAPRTTAFHIELDSDAFYIDHDGARQKLGFGSSAALTVALLGALHAAAGRPPPDLAACIAAHRAIQHGQGSGIDIAASLRGGLGHFELHDGRATHAPLALPAGLDWCCAYSGRPASTRALLATVAAWRAREPAACARHLGELATISRRGVEAVANHDAATFLASLHDYASTLARFGAASGADIASRGHRELAEIAAGCGVVYKSCGAGGGDVGITFGVEHGRVEAFASRAAAAGFAVLDAAAEPQGLITTVVDSSSRD